MEVSAEHRFASRREVVWGLLFDLESLRAAIPGCEVIEAGETGWYHFTVTAGIAAIRGSYRGTVHLREVQAPDSYVLTLEAEGVPGKVRGEATFRLRNEGGDTVVSYRGEVRAEGGLARLGARQLEGAARLLAGQFFREMLQRARDRTQA